MRAHPRWMRRMPRRLPVCKGALRYHHPTRRQIGSCTLGSRMEGMYCTETGVLDTTLYVQDYTHVAYTNTPSSECFCVTHLSPEAAKLSDDDCTAACPGDPRLSCGGKDAFAIYSLISATQKSSTGKDKSSSSSPLSSSSSSSSSSSPATTRLSSTLESSLSAPAKAPGIGMGALTPSTTPAPSHPPAFEGMMNSGGDKPPAPASTATVAAISGSMSGATLIGALLFFCFRAYKKRRVEQDARVAAMVLARNKKGGGQEDDNDDSNRGIFYERSPSRGRQRTRSYHHRPPSILVVGDAFRNGKDVRLTTDGVLVPTTPALESGGKDPASYYHSQQRQHSYNHTTGNHNTTGGDEQQAQRDSLFSALLGQVSVPVGLRTPPAVGSSSAVQWRRTADMAAAQSVPVSPMTQTPDQVAVPPGGLGERAWHRRRISTPYAPPPTAPLPPTPSSKKKRIVAAAAAVVGGRGGGRLGAGGADQPLQPPQRPPRRESAATFEAALANSPGATMSIPESYLDKTLEYDGDDEEGNGSGVKPIPPLKTRTTQPPPPRAAAASPDNNDDTVGGMVYLDRHHDGRQPKIPSLPPITSGELSEFDSRYWKSILGSEGSGKKRHGSDGGDDDKSPASATTVGTSILMESPTLPWDTDPMRRTAEHEKRK